MSVIPKALAGDAKAGSDRAAARLTGCRVLALMGRAPWPMDDGWKMRSGNLLKGLAELGATVDLVTFGDPAEPVPEPFNRLLDRVALVARRRSYALSDLARGAVFRTPFPVLNYRDRAFAGRIAQLSAGEVYDMLLAEDIVMAQYATQVRARVRFLDMHNVESHLMTRYAELERSPARRAYARITAAKLAAYERATTPTFDGTFVCSEDDRARLAEGGANGRVVVVPNGIDASFFRQQGAARRNDRIVFVGSMDYHANISGVKHFVGEILPLIRKRLPNVVTYVVGKNPPAEVRELSSDAVVVTGAVPDVRPYVESAAVVVVPLLVGGGTRLKILESMAMGRPTVSTTVGAEGLSVRDGDTVALADDPSEFADRVVALIEDPVSADAMGARAREYVVRNYDWRGIVGRIAESYHAASGEIAR